MATSSLAVTGTLLLGPQGSPAAADPPLTIPEAKAQVAQLQTEAEALDQEYLAVHEELKAGRNQLRRKQDEVAAQTARLKRMQQQVGQVALAQFQNRSLDATAQLLLTSDSDGFLSQVSTVEKVNENQNSVLQDFQAEQAALAALERSAEADVRQLAAQSEDLRRLREASDRKVAESTAVLERLTEEERRQIAAEEAKAAARARREAQRDSREEVGSTASRSGSRSVADTDEPTAEPGSGRGGRAVAFAKAQLGKPYRFAAAGPSAYDCSGLTSAAWAAAGVSLPRTSQAQYGAGRAVSRSELQPGDLVFFYSGISHVGLYVGNGSMIHSPRPGKTVEYSTISSMPWAGARRPG
ncbi:MAG: NlpC/P60 family protein [Actinomycetes bacterium]